MRPRNIGKLVISLRKTLVCQLCAKNPCRQLCAKNPCLSALCNNVVVPNPPALHPYKKQADLEVNLNINANVNVDEISLSNENMLSMNYV